MRERSPQGDVVTAHLESGEETLPALSGEPLVQREDSGELLTQRCRVRVTGQPAVVHEFRQLPQEGVLLEQVVREACLDDTVRLLAKELAQPQLATTVVLNHLVDILLIQLLRSWLASGPTQQAGSWLGILNDPAINEALVKMHREPGRAWTTAALAKEINVSRATLARRFPAVVGHTPLAYLTLWRMDLAAQKLRSGNDDLPAIAEAVGYTSVYAFSRAFSRVHGQPPGQYRLTSRARASSATGSPLDRSAFHVAPA